MVAVRPGGEPSTGLQVGVGVALIVIDLMVMGYLLFRYGITGWADSKDQGHPPEAPKEALRGMWLLVGGAVVTGGGLLYLRWRNPGIAQLVVLGLGAGLFACLSARE